MKQELTHIAFIPLTPRPLQQPKTEELKTEQPELRSGRRLAAAPEAERPGQVIVVTLTDGLENASTDHTTEKVGEMVRHQREHYGWEFLFLGTDLETIQSATRDLNIPQANSRQFARSGEGVQESMEASHDFVSERRRRKKKDN